MIAVMQTGQNCLQACLASFLELPLDEVPDFVNGTGDDWVQQCNAWLLARGWRSLAYKPTLDDVPNNAHLPWPRVTWWPKGWSIVQGTPIAGLPCARDVPDQIVEHVCVAYDGKVVHDPSPRRRGLAEVCCYWELTRP